MKHALLLALACLAGCSEAEPDPAPDPAPGPAPQATPGPQATSAPFEGTTLDSVAGHWRIEYRTRPAVIPLGEPFDVDVRVAPKGNTELPRGVELVVDAGMPQHGHGMNRTPLHEPGAPGEWTARGLLFHMPGAWTLTFDVTLDGLTERAATVVTLE